MLKERQRTLVIANWKMYKDSAETKAFIADLKPLIENSAAAAWIAVPFTSLIVAKEEAAGTKICIGGQNMNDATEGAFTGEIAAKMLVEVGASFVLLGHSERRHYFQESNAFINRKVKRALEAGLFPVLCIGESLSEREADEMEDILASQLNECLANIDAKALAEKLIIAYEPVWAIGTGLSATPQMAQEAHNFCREYLMQHWGAEIASQVPLLYGGSVKADNAASLLEQPDINGLLVGGASLDAASFAGIINTTTVLATPEEESTHNIQGDL